MQGHHRGRQDGTAETRESADSQTTPDVGLKLLQGGLCGFNLRGDAAKVLHEHGTGLGQPDLPPCPDKQRQSSLLFQHCQLLAYRRSGHVQLGGGRRHGALKLKCFEDMQPTDIEHGNPPSV